MKQTRIRRRAKAPCEGDPIRTSLDPRDADVVRAKALGRAAPSSEMARRRAA